MGIYDNAENDTDEFTPMKKEELTAGTLVHTIDTFGVHDGVVTAELYGTEDYVYVDFGTAPHAELVPVNRLRRGVYDD